MIITREVPVCAPRWEVVGDAVIHIAVLAGCTASVRYYESYCRGSWLTAQIISQQAILDLPFKFRDIANVWVIARAVIHGGLVVNIHVMCINDPGAISTVWLPGWMHCDDVTLVCADCCALLITREVMIWDIFDENGWVYISLLTISMLKVHEF